MKNNTSKCMLLSPDEYIKLLNALNDAKLLALAAQRMEHYDPQKTISQEAVDREFDFDADDLSTLEDVDFE